MSRRERLLRTFLQTPTPCRSQYFIIDSRVTLKRHHSVVEEELGVGGSNTIIHNGTSGWEDVEEEDEDLAHLEDIENGHPMEGIEERAVITVRDRKSVV